MVALTFLMTCLLGYQVLMPQVNNAKYAFTVDRDGVVIRMNTQDGTMERCDKELKCGEIK
jgi:hypothetical protein